MPRVTGLLIAINIAIYLWQTLTGHGDDVRWLLTHGALYGPLVAQGEYWRLLTAAFLHGGLTHVALNMISLFYLGSFLERVLGSTRMLALYLACALLSSLAVYIFDPLQVTIGASGAIFGLMGGIITIGLRLGSQGRDLLRQFAPLLLLNLFVTFSVSFISKGAHVGGLIAGFFLTFLLYVPPRRPVVVDARSGRELDARFEPR